MGDTRLTDIAAKLFDGYTELLGNLGLDFSDGNTQLDNAFSHVIWVIS